MILPMDDIENKFHTARLEISHNMLDNTEC